MQTLASFTVSLDTIANGGTLVTFNTGGWTLNASTQYFVAACYTSAGSAVTARLGTTAIASGSWPQSGMTFNQFAQAGPGSDNYYVQLTGTINAGAVPASGLAALGGLGFAVGRRRRR